MDNIEVTPNITDVSKRKPLKQLFAYFFVRNPNICSIPQSENECTTPFPMNRRNSPQVCALSVYKSISLSYLSKKNYQPKHAHDLQLYRYFYKTAAPPPVEHLSNNSWRKPILNFLVHRDVLQPAGGLADPLPIRLAMFLVQKLDKQPW